MVDSLELGWRSEGTVGEAEVRCLVMAAQGGRVSEQRSVEGEEPRGVAWWAEVPGVGMLRLGREGYVSWGGSLPKAAGRLAGVSERELGNECVLSCDQVARTFADVVEGVIGALPFVGEGGWSMRVRRADVCYQRWVPDSVGVINAVRGAVKPTRGNTSWFSNAGGVPTGVVWGGRAVVHRLYDKGLECGNGELVGMLRSEEQLRHGSTGLAAIVDLSGLRFRREECVRVLNERYLEAGLGERIDVGKLVDEGAYGKALFALHPEFLGYYRGRVNKRAYCYMARAVREVRASAVPVDLRVPEDAWLEESAA